MFNPVDDGVDKGVYPVEATYPLVVAGSVP